MKILKKSDGKRVKCRVQSVRMLRDYSKHRASLPLSFESKRFVISNFQCCHPLEYYHMQSRLNAKVTPLEDLISLLLRIINLPSHTIRTISTALRARSSTNQKIKTIVCIFEKLERPYVTSIVLVVKKEAVNLYNTYLARNMKIANIDALTCLKG
ncbi:hypothetical protein BDC45DRAFT_533697 [Circinella umbellata]|nr:hypothetical protein BDC45DRAFT_533697 [Circinella umbellata]